MGPRSLSRCQKKTTRGVRPTANTVDGVVGKATQTFEKALSSLAPVSSAILDSILRIPTRPSELAVEIGFKLSGKGNLILAATEGEASFKAILKWTKAETDASVKIESQH
jgi:Trypsin-co-occurring domain 1